MWRVTLKGKDSSMEYTYHVQAPKDATPNRVQMSAFREHGSLVAAGVVTEYAHPIPLEVNFLG
jgi:hypothetical protein